MRKDKDGLRIPRACVCVARTMKDDYVYDRLGHRWLTVTRILRSNGVIYIEGVSQRRQDQNGTVRVLANECYPAWNPRTRSWGREENSHRKQYWIR